jgi:hypothetical protein
MNVEHEGDRTLKPRSRGDAVDDREKPSGSMRAIRASRDVCKMKSRNGDGKAGSQTDRHTPFYRRSELGILLRRNPEFAGF